MGLKDSTAPALPYEGSGESKKQQVKRMFDRISRSYDLVNRVLSAGMDLYWRRVAVRALSVSAGDHILDLATGTGDLALALAKKTAARVTAADISDKMIALAREKVKKGNLSRRITLVSADSAALPFAPNTFHAVTIAFGIRNFEHVERSIRNMHRVLKPRGRLVILELSTPRNWLFSKLYSAGFLGLSTLVGGVLSGHRQAYQYLWRSVQHFPEGQALVNLLKGGGFENVSWKPLTGGVCSLYVAQK